jgi:hypothetical protein
VDGALVGAGSLWPKKNVELFTCERQLFFFQTFNVKGTCMIKTLHSLIA